MDGRDSKVLKKDFTKGYDPDYDIKTTGGDAGHRMAEAIYQAEKREEILGRKQFERRVLGWKDVNDLDALGDYITQEFGLYGQPIEGEISWEEGNFGRGLNFPVIRKYNFFGKIIEETANYDNRIEAEETALENGINNLGYKIKPLKIKASSSRDLAKVVIEKED